MNRIHWSTLAHVWCIHHVWHLWHTELIIIHSLRWYLTGLLSCYFTIVVMIINWNLSYRLLQWWITIIKLTFLTFIVSSSMWSRHHLFLIMKCIIFFSLFLIINRVLMIFFITSYVRFSKFFLNTWLVYYLRFLWWCLSGHISIHS